MQNRKVTVPGLVHDDGHGFFCVVCGKGFAGEADLKQHLKSHDGPGLNVGGEALKISLKGCSWTTTTREGLEGTAVAITQAMRACKMSIKCLLFGLQMFRGLQNTVELGCIGCGQHFEGKENMEMHMKSVHNDCPDDGPSAGKDEVPEGWDELSGGAEDTVEVDLLLVPIPSPIGALSPDLALEQVYEGLQVPNLQPRDPQPDLAKCRFMGVQLLLQLQPGAGLTPAPVPGPGPGVVGEIFLSLLRFLDACPAPQEGSSPAQFQTFPEEAQVPYLAQELIPEERLPLSRSVKLPQVPSPSPLPA